MITDFNTRAEEARKILFEAIGKGDATAVTTLLKLHPEGIGWTDSTGRNPLGAAIRDKKEELVPLLVEQGCDINHGDKDHWTPLIDAVNASLPATVKLLVNKGARLEERIESSQMTALLVGAMMARNACVEILLAAGASTEARDDRNMNSLQWARDAKHAVTAALIEGFPARQQAKRLAEKIAAADAIETAVTAGTAAPLQVGKPIKLKS